MSETTPGAPGSADWKARFQEIRNRFIDSFREVSSTHPGAPIRACDHEGTPINWVFEQTDAGITTRPVGDGEDAAQFLTNMIDQGMKVAFCKDSRNESVWLTCWETPSSEPVWPQGVVPDSEGIHLGIR